MDVKFRHEELSKKALRSIFLKRFISKKKALILLLMVIVLFLILSQVFEMYDLYSVEPYLVLALALIGLLVGAWWQYHQLTSWVYRQERDREYVINNIGVGYKTPGLNYFLEWASVDLIRETESFIVIQSNSQAQITIYKFAIEKELLQSINDILKNAPIKGRGK